MYTKNIYHTFSSELEKYQYATPNKHITGKKKRIKKLVKYWVISGGALATF